MWVQSSSLLYIPIVTVDDLGLDPCACRKPKSGRIGDRCVCAVQELKETREAKWLYNFGCVTTMDIVQLIYRPRDPQGASKDYEFGRATMNARWAQGYSDARTTLFASPWLAPVP
ncbi:MAG TPA: DUF3734 domain-containing protein [Xanthobacteraceae bacterium]|nr:DUF3734 domain-containing protein [Xanthobacteraceae bacterium]